MIKFSLNSGWELKEAPLSYKKNMAPLVSRKQDGWYKGLNLPLDVHMPLIDAGVIKDPALSDYCFEGAWIEERSWWFKKTFQIQEKSPVMELVLESLDVHGDIFLNDVHLGHHASAFYPFRREVSEYLAEGENTLLVRLTAGLEHVTDADLAEIDHLVCVEGERNPDRGDLRRAFVRKPSYVFGWDWCPRVGTVAIGDAYIECAEATGLVIRGISIETTEIDIKNNTAKLKATLEVELLDIIKSADGDISISLTRDEDNLPIVSVTLPDVLLCSGINYVNVDLFIKNPLLWWPNGMGAQPLYKVTASVSSRGTVSHYPPFNFGIRKITLDTSRTSETHRKFEIQINGKPVFMKGGNWIPSDSIYARITPEKYSTLVSEAKEANFNTLRVWGGGLYERDEFYNACDREGILVWQDMMFACSTYPDHQEDFYNLVGKELDYQTKRLRNRACLAILCGNNENAVLFWHRAQFTREKQFGNKTANIQIREYVQKNCPHIPYWNSSPYGGKDPNSPDIGNVHHWNACMMNPEMALRIEPKEYDKVTARFVSEYGYPGPCVLKSIQEYFDGKPVIRDGDVWNLHNNTFEKLTVAAGIKKHYTDKELSLDEYLLYAGMVQSLMLGYSLESLRFKEFCGGGLYWMYNDCWGETGWSIVDYYLRRKIAFYGVRRTFEPVKLILRETGCGEITVVGCNDTQCDVAFDMKYGYVSFDGQKDNSEVTPVVIPAHSRKTLATFAKAENDGLAGIWYAAPSSPTSCKPGILRYTDYRNLKTIPAKWEAQSESKGNDLIVNITAKTYCHGVHLVISSDAHLSDNYFDLLPGESRTITVKGQAGNTYDIKAIEN